MTRTEDKPFRILALSGGGFRGLFTGLVLARLEQEIGSPIARKFDLITGTSVGGILALGLALEIPAAKLVALFEKHGSEIFRPRAPKLLHWPHSLFRAKYTQHRLADLLSGSDLFGNNTIGNLHHPVVVPAVNYTTGRPQMFKTPHHSDFRNDWRLRLVDVALATSAAPTYFPIFRAEQGSFVDGGLFANMPGLVALHEADRFFGIPLDETYMLAIGTMSTDQGYDPKLTRDRGLWQWRKALLEVTISSQEWMFRYMLDHRLGNRLHTLDATARDGQAERIDLDDTSQHAREILLGHATAVAQMAIGKPQLMALLAKDAPTPRFHYGPQTNCQQENSNGKSQ